MVFLKIEIKKNLVVPPDQLDSRGLFLRKNIILRLLDGIARLKASKEHGYYVAVNTLDSLGDGLVDQLTGNVTIPVTFTCTAVMPCKGEILIGTIDKVVKSGIFLKAGPMENIFLSEKMMKEYQYSPSEGPMFVNRDWQEKMEKGGKVRFRVIGIKWIECNREFQMLASLEGGFLRPI